MGVYINMEMPEDSDIIVIYSDGTARKYLSYTRVIIDEAKAIHVPPHGKLIDADALRQDWLENGENDYVYDTNSFLYSLDDAPTIIPADEE